MLIRLRVLEKKTPLQKHRHAVEWTTLSQDFARYLPHASVSLVEFIKIIAEFLKSSRSAPNAL